MTTDPRGGNQAAAGVQMVTDFRVLQQKRQMAELARSRIEEEMRENHPYFDRPLFFVGRDSKLRRFCVRVARARYGDGGEDNNSQQGANTTTKGGGKKYKQLQ